MNRRRFLAVVGAVLAAPIAAAKGWFEKPKVRSFPGPNDVIGWRNWTGTYKPACESCGIAVVAECYPRDLSKVDRSKYVGGIIDDPMPPLFLCESCAEKEGYLVDINLIVKKKRKNAVLEINQRTEQYLYGKEPTNADMR